MRTQLGSEYFGLAGNNPGCGKTAVEQDEHRLAKGRDTGVKGASGKESRTGRSILTARVMTPYRRALSRHQDFQFQVHIV